jgi:hypothetical protein
MQASRGTTCAAITTRFATIRTCLKSLDQPLPATVSAPLRPASPSAGRRHLPVCRRAATRLLAATALLLIATTWAAHSVGRKNLMVS